MSQPNRPDAVPPTQRLSRTPMSRLPTFASIKDTSDRETAARYRTLFGKLKKEVKTQLSREAVLSSTLPVSEQYRPKKGLLARQYALPTHMPKDGDQPQSGTLTKPAKPEQLHPVKTLYQSRAHLHTFYQKKYREAYGTHPPGHKYYPFPTALQGPAGNTFAQRQVLDLEGWARMADRVATSRRKEFVDREGEEHPLREVMRVEQAEGVARERKRRWDVEPESKGFVAAKRSRWDVAPEGESKKQE
ncbi:hypothetical protein MBLNU230_g5541t1 [Neophaeotheca triangularis]